MSDVVSKAFIHTIGLIRNGATLEYAYVNAQNNYVMTEMEYSSLQVLIQEELKPKTFVFYGNAEEGIAYKFWKLGSISEPSRTYMLSDPFSDEWCLAPGEVCVRASEDQAYQIQKLIEYKQKTEGAV